MDNMSYKEVINIIMADLHDKIINGSYNDDEIETNMTVTDDFKSVADSTYADMICN